MQIPFIDLKTQYRRNKSNIDKAIDRVLERGQYIMGPDITDLETQLADYIGVKHAVTCSSGTDALVIALMAMGVQAGDAVFTSPFTFFATAESISLCGATPVFVDIDPFTYNLDPNKLKEKVSEVINMGTLTPRAVIPVDLFGLAADYLKINEVAKQHNLFVLEDAAQAFGAIYHDKKAGNLGHAAATSFYPAKPLGCYGDGGAVFTNNPELHEKMLSLRVHGQATSGNKYDNVRIGLNARMDTIQAAVLLEKLKIYDDELKARNAIAKKYNNALNEFVTVPQVPKGQQSVWAQYSIQVDDREKLRSDLTNQGLPTAVFYPIPIHLSTAYQHLDHKAGDFPVSEAVSEKIVSLPMHPYLNEEQVNKVINAVVESTGN